MLKEDRSSIREEAAWILGEMKSQKAIDLLIHTLNDKEMGWMAALALGKIGSERAVKALIHALKDKNIQKRRVSTWALGQIPSDKAVRYLIAALKDKDEEVRMWAVEALKKRGSPKALKAVKKNKKKICKTPSMALLDPPLCP